MKMILEEYGEAILYLVLGGFFLGFFLHLAGLFMIG